MNVDKISHKNMFFIITTQYSTYKIESLSFFCPLYKSTHLDDLEPPNISWRHHDLVENSRLSITLGPKRVI